MTKVLRVIARLNMGGPAQHVALLSGRRFDALGYDTTLVHGPVAAGEASMEEVADAEGATRRSLPTLVQPIDPLKDARALASLSGMVRAIRPDIVHTHTAKAGILGRFAARRMRPRPLVIHTYHGHVLRGYFGPAKTRLYTSLERRAARGSDMLIGVSRATVDDLVGLGVAPADRFRVVPLGLDLDRFAAIDPAPDRASRERLGIGGDELLLTYMGRIVPIKRLDLMLAAVSEARRSGARVKLAVVGDGEIRPRLEQQAKQLGIADAVDFLGYRRDLEPILAASDAAILTSDNEGTPVSLIEAAAAARPAVSTDVGGVRDVVTPETGIVVPPGDVPALAEAIVSIAGNPEARARMGSEARQRAIARYSAARLIDDVDALYRELLRAKTGR